MNQLKILFITVCMTAICLTSYAQDKEYAPTTNWPYLYEDFREGEVTTLQMGKIKHSQLNISLARGMAHFIQNGTLMELDLRAVVSVNIGDDLFVPASGSLVKVLKKTDHGTTAVSTTVNHEAMSRSEVGYGGTSSLTNTQKVSANAISGALDISAYKSISDITQKDGKKLILKNVKGIVYQGAFIPAARYDILNIKGIDKKAVRKFLKDNKIRFTDEDDLSLLAEYIGTLPVSF